jgi:hypothetical protein
MRSAPIIAVSTACERDARAGWHEHQELFGFQEITAVRSSPAVRARRLTCDCERVSHRGTSLGRVKLRKMVAEEFEGNASFSDCEPLRDEPLKFDRADFRPTLSACERRCVVRCCQDSSAREAASEEGRGRGCGSSSRGR